MGAFMIVMMGIFELSPGPSGLYKVYHTDCEGNAGHRILGVSSHVAAVETPDYRDWHRQLS